MRRRAPTSSGWARPRSTRSPTIFVPTELLVRAGLEPHHAVAVLLVQENVQGAAVHGRGRVDTAPNAERGIAVVRGLRRSQERQRHAADIGQLHRNPVLVRGGRIQQPRRDHVVRVHTLRHCLGIGLFAKAEPQVQPVRIDVGPVDEQRELARPEFCEAPAGHLPEQARPETLAAPPWRDADAPEMAAPDAQIALSEGRGDLPSATSEKLSMLSTLESSRKLAAVNGNRKSGPPQVRSWSASANQVMRSGTCAGSKRWNFTARYPALRGR